MHVQTRLGWRATVVAPLVETVVSIAGTSMTSQASYLWLQGTTFANSTYVRPSQAGFRDVQAGQYALTATTDDKQTVGRAPAGVSVMNANHIHFERNIFTQMGATGLDFVSGTHDDMVIGDVVTDVAGYGCERDHRHPASNSSSVSSTAGIEASYADIKNTAIPLPAF